MEDIINSSLVSDKETNHPDSTNKVKAVPSRKSDIYRASVNYENNREERRKVRLKSERKKKGGGVL